jgi:hypothetical protein
MPKPLVVVRALLVPALALPAGFAVAAAWSGPVVCTTTLEAPPMTTAGAPGAAVPNAPELNAVGPVEVTRCVAVETTPQLVQRRFNTYTAPFAQGVSITNQITDLLGIAMGGGDGTRVMGFGFPDQTIVWDGTALENTYRVLLEQQSDPMPWRTADINNGFSGSLGASGASGASPGGTAGFRYGGGPDGTPPVRGLW